MSPFRIVFLDTKSSNGNHYMFNAAARALRNNRAVESLHVADYGNALSLAIEGNANLFIAFDGESLEDEVCSRLRHVCGRSALWVTEDPYELPYNKRSAALFDLVFTNDLPSVAAYGEKGRHLPLAADPALHYLPVLADDDSRLRYDLCFIGYAWPNRVDLIRAIIRDHPGLRLKIALAGNEQRLHVDLPQPSSYRFKTSPREFARLANGSRVTLAIARDFTTNPEGTSFSLTPPPRVFETAAAGSFQLYDGNVDHLRKYYDAGSEIVPFANYEECKARLAWALAKPRERVAVAAAAQRRTLREHTYEQRIATLLEACASVPVIPRAGAGASRRKRVLYVTGQPGSDADFGGVALQGHPDFEFLRYAPEASPAHNRYRVTDEAGSVVEKIVFDGDLVPFAFANTAKERRFADILIEYRIDLVHFNHLAGHPLSLPLISRALGIKSVATLNDYYGVCDSPHLIDDRRRFCDVFTAGDGGCDLCTTRRTGKPHRAQMARRVFLDTVWAAVDQLIVPSETTRAHYACFYPETMNGDHVSVLPLPLPERAVPAPLRTNGKPRDADEPGRDGRPLVVAFLGDFTYEQGGDALVLAAEGLRDENVRFRVYGRAEPRLAELVAATGSPNVRLFGDCDPGMLPQLLADVDVTLHLPIWPDTSGTTLAEAWANDCVPIVTASGVLGERVENRKTGFVVRPDRPGELLSTLLEILSEPERLELLRRNVRRVQRFDEAGHRERLLEIYRRLGEAVPAYEGRGAHDWRGPELNVFSCGVTLSPWALKDIGEVWREAKVSDVLGGRHDRKDGGFTPARMAGVREARAGAFQIVDVDGSPAHAGATIRKSNGDSVSLRALAPLDAKDLAAELLLIGEGGTRAYACRTSSERSDRGAAGAGSGTVTALLSGEGSREAVVPGRYRFAVRYNDAVTKATAGPELAIESKVSGPEDFAALRIERVTARFSIDHLSGRPLPSTREPAIVNGHMTIGGWTDLPLHAGERQTPWIVLENLRRGERRYAQATTQHRPDVANALESERLAYSGFSAAVPAGALSAGAYDVSLGADDGQTLFISQPVLQIVVEGERA